jgi:PAS domain S-box-containing protein
MSAQASPGRLEWQRLPRRSQLYVIAVVFAGASAAALYSPREWPPLGALAALMLASCLTSMWKVNLPMPLSSGSTLSVSLAANLMALLLLGPGAALVVACAGAWTQCTVKVKRAYPLYRTAFSVAAEAVTMAATGLAYVSLGGQFRPSDFSGLAKPLVGAIATYFVLNTGLVAVAIALSSRQSLVKIWREDFLWSAASFTVVGTVGAAAAVGVVHGQQWTAVLMVMPVYLAYQAYSILVGRLDDERRHAADTERQRHDAVAALQAVRRSEQALAEEKERLAVMLRSIGDGVIACDLDGTILLINNVAEVLTGWPRDEAIGRPLASVFQDVDVDTRKRCDDTLRALAGSAGLRRSSLLVARDLSERPIEACATLFSDAEGRPTGMVLAFRDISDALRAQEQRANAGRLASLGLLAGGIAHDFNNILMAIMGNISMVRATSIHAASASAALAEAEQACVRARQITWQLLTFSKGGVPVRKPVNVARVLDEAAALALRGSDVTLAFDLVPDLWHIEADATQLVQVFTNLLINAQEAMPHGGVVTVRGENVIEARSRTEHGLRVDPGAYVRISAIDQGLGIPKEHIPRVFDPYFSTKQRGSGLGLATTYSIVKNHGGFITVTSELGRGTTIEVNFAAARAIERHGVQAPVISREGGRPRILVMDDEASIRTLTSNMLEFLGYDAETVDTGTLAIERFKRALADGCPFDAVLLDLVVPGDLGGREAIEHLSGFDPTVRAILVSGYAQNATMSGYRELGFAAAMTKPYTLQELQATLETVITTAAWRVH